MNRRLFLGAALMALTGCHKTPVGTPSPPHSPSASSVEEAIRRGQEFIVSRQMHDGSWRSEVYGVLKDGVSLTPFCAKALLFAPLHAQASEAARKATTFLAFQPAQRPLEMQPLVYPVYSAAGAAMLLSYENHTPHLKGRDEWLHYLEARQLIEPLGWNAKDAVYGGWSYAPHILRKKDGGPEPDVNLSATLFAVGAMVMSGRGVQQPAVRKALSFVQRCQNDDGGFFFSPSHPYSNKAGSDRPGHYRSYGTTTADGLRALLRCGVSLKDAGVQKSRQWLNDHFQVDPQPGDFPQAFQVERDSHQHYWLWSCAHAASALMRQGEPRPSWAPRITESLLKTQNADGSWTNRFTRALEDDPLVSTPLALAALHLLR